MYESFIFKRSQCCPLCPSSDFPLEFNEGQELRVWEAELLECSCTTGDLASLVGFLCVEVFQAPEMAVLRKVVRMHACFPVLWRTRGKNRFPKFQIEFVFLLRLRPSAVACGPSKVQSLWLGAWNGWPKAFLAFVFLCESHSLSLA